MSLLTCRKIAVLNSIILTLQLRRLNGAHFTSSEKASSVPGRMQTAVVRSSGGKLVTDLGRPGFDVVETIGPTAGCCRIRNRSWPGRMASARRSALDRAAQIAE